MQFMIEKNIQNFILSTTNDKINYELLLNREIFYDNH